MDKTEGLRDKAASIKERETLGQETQELLDELLEALAESERSNRALRRAALKAAGTGGMSTRLKDALYE
ncbi:Ni2+-binding GTPase [Paenibacillus spiritus]|uniref:Ni2+-binding GTPase n=1 Tax=Paenibacillus spiritus TaxID=2496557 RepID=A0A5J5GIY8_9BACL|nr:Ni2+-binding GTPase [Paenibacillus spiritus]KAA9007454.1 Ni2+-binding GTPase [Paenibacillus spiritus]